LIFVGILIGRWLTLRAIETPSAPVSSTEAADGVTVVSEFRVHFIDVGQGDSTLIQTPNGINILIDGGDSNGLAIAYLQSQGVRHLDAVIASHPHADHIGGLIDVMNSLSVDSVWTSGATHTTSTFESFIDTIAERQIPYHEVRSNDVITIEDVTFDVLHGVASAANLNDTSLVLRLEYGQISILFMGDAEQSVEQLLLTTSAGKLRSTLLKIGHHGSATSSSLPFLNAVHPEAAIYTAGGGNNYGHPHESTLNNFASVGARVYGTDLHGTIIVHSDGSIATITTAIANPPIYAAMERPQLMSSVESATPVATIDPTRAYLFGRDKDCSAFATQAQAQEFFIAAGGPENDRHRLDGNNDGIACESLP